LDEVYRDERNNGIFGYTNHLEDVIN
jgi:hypothetical protein